MHSQYVVANVLVNTRTKSRLMGVDVRIDEDENDESFA
jgi:hypothetical protein